MRRAPSPLHTRRERETPKLTPDKDIKFVAVARAMDRVVVASLTVQRGDDAEQYHTAVREVLAAPDFTNKVSPNARYKFVAPPPRGLLG